MADIFISYTSEDRDWAFWIAHELETLGHTLHIHEWEISATAITRPGWRSGSTGRTTYCAS